MAGIDCTNMVQYTVQQGDSLSKIAKRFGTTVEELQAVQENNITNIDDIDVGQSLFIPNQQLFHVVKKGDTAWAVAKKYGYSPEDLRLETFDGREASLSRLEVGDKLHFPTPELCHADGSSMLDNSEAEIDVYNGYGTPYGDVNYYTGQISGGECSDVPEEEPISMVDALDGPVDESEPLVSDTSSDVEAVTSAYPFLIDDEPMYNGDTDFALPDPATTWLDGLGLVYDGFGVELNDEDGVCLVEPAVNQTSDQDEIVLESAIGLIYMEDVVAEDDVAATQAMTLLANMSPTDANYFSETLDILLYDLGLEYNFSELHSMKHPSNYVASEFQALRDEIRDTVCDCVPEDSSFPFFLDTIMDAGVYDPAEIAAAAQGMDTIFYRMYQDPSNPGMQASEAARTEFVFGFFRERANAQTADEFKFGLELESTFVDGIDHLLLLSDSSRTDAQSRMICSVCAQHMGILLARMNVDFSYRYGVMGKVTETTAYDGSRDPFEAAPEKTVVNNSASELHVWLEVAGEEWEATALMKKKEVEAQYSDPVGVGISSEIVYVMVDGKQEARRRDHEYQRISWFYNESASHSNPFEPARVDAYNAAFAVSQRGYQILNSEVPQTSQYEILSDELDRAILEDPSCLDAYTQSAEVKRRLAKGMDGFGEQKVEYYRQACEHLAAAFQLIQDPGKKKEIALSALTTAMSMATDLRGEYHSGIWAPIRFEQASHFAGIDLVLEAMAKDLNPSDFQYVLYHTVVDENNIQGDIVDRDLELKLLGYLEKRICENPNVFNERQWEEIASLFDAYRKSNGQYQYPDVMLYAEEFLKAFEERSQQVAEFVPLTFDAEDTAE